MIVPVCKAIPMLESIFCDSKGNPSFRGSDGDFAIFQEAMKLLYEQRCYLCSRLGDCVRNGKLDIKESCTSFKH
jgi:hypothetical protein